MKIKAIGLFVGALGFFNIAGLSSAFSSTCNSGTCWEMKFSGDYACQEEIGSQIICDVGSGPSMVQNGDELFDCYPSTDTEGSYASCDVGTAHCYTSYFECKKDDGGQTFYTFKEKFVSDFPTDRGVGKCK